jgi:sigma-E factor negative regulatory protein RseA
MTESNRETLSAGMDGELSREELRFLLRRLDHDDSLCQAWSDYHLARDGLRGQMAPRASVDFASRVMAALDAVEVADVRQVQVVGKRRHWFQWSAGGAIAASVAVAALMLTQPAGHEASPSTTRMAAASEPTATNTLTADASAPAVPQWLSATSASQLTQQAAFGGVDGSGSYPPQLMPYQVPRARMSGANDGRYLLMIRPDGTGYVQPVTNLQVESH